MNAQDLRTIYEIPEEATVHEFISDSFYGYGLIDNREEGEVDVPISTVDITDEQGREMVREYYICFRWNPENDQ